MPVLHPLQRLARHAPIALAVLLGGAAVNLDAQRAQVPAGSPRFDQSSAEADRYDFVEITATLPAPPAGNPFVDAAFVGEFTDPAGTTRRVEGFADSEDGRVFRVRYMPMSVGRHTYTLRLMSGTRSASQQGVVVAREGGRRGLLRLDPGAPRHFRWEGTGEHCFVSGTTAYWLLGFQDVALIEESIDRLARLGVNRIRVSLSGRTRDGMRWREPDIVPTDAFQFRLEPWVAARPADIENPGYDVTRFNLVHFRKAERMLAHARARDMLVSVVFHLDGQDPGVDPFGKAGMGGPDEERYYRYVLARLGAYSNVMWDLTNEWHLFRTDAWVESIGALVERTDPYAHLASVHGRGTFPYRTSAWADFASFQSWDEHGGYAFMLKNRREQDATGRPLPQINEEYGYEDHYPYPWGQARRWPARTADTRRRLAWEIAMAGGYQSTGERANVPGHGGWITGRGNDAMTMLVGYGHMRRFFEGLPWWELDPQPEIVTVPPAPPLPPGVEAPKQDVPPTLHGDPMALAKPGARYVFYLPRGGAVTANVTPGRYRARWYNPRNGEWLGTATMVDAGEKWTSPVAPDAEDWALVLDR